METNCSGSFVSVIVHYERAAYLDVVSFACHHLDSVAWIQKSHCKICGVGMDGMDYAGLTCRNCREFTPQFSAGRSMFHLNHSGKALVHEIKYDGEKRVLDDMPFFLERVPQFHEFITGAVLIPVPLHPKKLYQRRFNQSLWIAEAFFKEAGQARLMIA